MQWLLHTSRPLEILHQWKIYWSNQLELGRWRQKHPSTSEHLISLSSPTALLGFKDLRALRTKFTLTLSRWNSKGRVLEVKTVETFWNGFANTFPTETKYWFMILATERFSVCHFPFSKIEETVDFLVPGSTCFIARHISQESPQKKIFKKELRNFKSTLEREDIHKFY